MKRVIPNRTAEQLRMMFSLREDGVLLWTCPPKPHPDLLGKTAGSPLPANGKSYWCVQIDRRKVRRSHIVFCMTRGFWPVDQVDHIDGNSLNDRPNNLREATQTQNAWNHKGRAKHSGLPMGIRATPYGRFTARIAVNKAKFTLGTFTTLEQAESVYRAARAHYFGEFA